MLYFSCVRISQNKIKEIDTIELDKGTKDWRKIFLNDQILITIFERRDFNLSRFDID